MQVKLPGAKPIPVTRADLIVGEMACLSGSPRNASIVATGDGEVWEVRRNVLDRMMRSPTQQGLFEQRYRQRALAGVLRTSELFADLPAEDYDDCIEFLQPRITFLRVSPGQTIFRQGAVADSLYLVRLGQVRIGISRAGKDTALLYRGPGAVIGEMGLLAISRKDAGRSVGEVCGSLCVDLAGENGGPAPGLRTATCSALDHVELARVDRGVFLELLQRYPALLGKVVRTALDRLKEPPDLPQMRQFMEQGLYQAKNLLALDMTRCTQCDECTKACIQQHGTTSHGQPITRLIREGLLFGDYLVAHSCRSCKDAYCMIGCPVDAIHRGKHHQIIIEDHCIGCGLCARNCPYDNIFMEPNAREQMEVGDPERPGQTHLVARPKAATCDLCDPAGREDRPRPRCVYACPHDAAIRMTGEELLERVIASI